MTAPTRWRWESVQDRDAGDLAAFKRLCNIRFGKLTQTISTLTGNGVTPDWVNVRSFGATGNGVTDDTAALGLAFAEGIATGRTVYVPPGTYRIVPAIASTDAAGVITVAFLLRSGLHILADPGAVFKLANSQSTDAAPKSLALFHTNQPLADVSVEGLTLDMNGANNPISPLRPATYQLGFNMAMISVSGDAALIDGMRIERCQFWNTPGTCCIVAGQSNTPGIPLGSNWTVRHNVFRNNGLDTSDHTSFFGWTDVVDVQDNVFWSDTPYGTVGKVGAQTAFEVHGHSHTCHDNLIYNYARAAFASINYTSDVFNADIHDNVMLVQTTGVAVHRGGVAPQALSDVRIHDNVVMLVEHVYTGVPQQVAFSIEPDLGVSDINICDNHCRKMGANTIGSVFATVIPSGSATFTNIRINDNTAVGLGQGVQIRTDFTSAALGYVEAVDNTFINFEAAGTVSAAIGFFVRADNGIKTLVLDHNKFIDERAGLATFQYGIWLQNGTITDLWTNFEAYKGLTTLNYVEVGGVVITNHHALAAEDLTNGVTGTGRVVLQNSPAMVTPSADNFISSQALGFASFSALVASTLQKLLVLANTGNGGFYFGIESSVAGAFFLGAQAYASVLYSTGNPVQLITGSAPVGVTTFNPLDTVFGGGHKVPYRSVSADTTLADSDYSVDVNAAGAARVITLPPATGRGGMLLHVKKTDASANTVTVDGDGAETIDGAANVVLATQYDNVSVRCTGSGWGVL